MNILCTLTSFSYLLYHHIHYIPDKKIDKEFKVNTSASKKISSNKFNDNSTSEDISIIENKYKRSKI